MGILRVALLATTVTGILVWHRQISPPRIVAGGVVLALLTTAINPGDAADALRPLAEPLAFLVCAVPLAVLLDRVDFFEAAAERVSMGRRLRLSLWLFAAAVTTLFNLDAAVVLLTPLYLRIARRHGLDPITTAMQPILLAALASSALPVSNLTNLIAAEQLDLGVADFALRLGPASVVAVAVGWLIFRRIPVPPPEGETAPATIEGRAFRVGLPVVVLLLVGFTVGDAYGIAPWLVAAAVLIVLMLVVGEVPVRSIPLGAVVVASGLAILAAAASPHLGLAGLLGGHGARTDTTAFVVGVVGADTINNLPALLVGLPHLESTNAVWAFLAGVNFGPVLWTGGSLAGLLWLDTMQRFGMRVSPTDYAKVGVKVGLPGLLAAGAVVLITGWLGAG